MPLPPRSSFGAPKTLIARPQLPTDHSNPYIKRIEPNNPPPVKFQEIVRDGHSTIVGRIKIPTPGGHAFILRRLDTGAISLTTMFRAAFPTAPEEAEKAETSWVKLTYETAGANKSGKARFAGTWVTPDVAESLAEGYALSALIRPLAAAQPNPDAIHRKKSLPSQTTPVSSPAPPVVATAPRDGPNPSKRRREASPAPSSTGATAGTTTPKPPSSVAKSTPPSSRVEKPESTPSRLPVTSKRAPSPAYQAPPPATPQSLRRSTRLKSPAPTSAPSSQRTVVGSPKTPKVATIREEVTPGGSDETAVEEETAIVAKSTRVSMIEDVREQKALIARLKAERIEKFEREYREKEKEKERAAKRNSTKNLQGEKTQEVIEVDESDEEVTLINVNSQAGSSKAQKRAREEEEQLRFNFKEGGEDEDSEREKEERAIVSNSRVKRVTPERKQLAWGALAFAAGLSAIAYLPATLPSFF